MKAIKIISLALMLLLCPAVISATSHYSFEHAEELKPLINWRDYGPSPFEEALRENKPIFLLLTAPSWCYWCQVYESEEYLFHPDVYPFINEHFIPIYVDADKRQDITRQYLEGGWPSTTVMAPNRERLFGFSGPRPPQNMLINLQRAVEYAGSQSFLPKRVPLYENRSMKIPDEEQLNNLINGYASVISGLYDPMYGGFGVGALESTQKFPQPRTLEFSLELYESTNEGRWLEIVQNTLQNQYTKIDEIETDYNLYDPVEGGFHRYGTRRDWTPPHYEKMLYDNAKLLRTYAHLLQLKPDDKLVKEVVDRTQAYIEENWYDEEEGGFYGNTDVFGEDDYYGKFPRPKEKPRVEKTKYTDWNSEAILTYLYLWEITGDEKFREMAIRSLDFFMDEMLTDNGAYHYKKEDGERGVQGNLLDNSYSLLAFIRGYEILEKGTYLNAAKSLADYSLENLYDWNSGGFFERNSPDKNLYAPGEDILLAKPTEENGIMAYALLRIYRHTENPLYLDAGIKTLGAKMEEIGGLDGGYYYVKAAQFINSNNLLEEFYQNEEETKDKKPKTFWLNDLLDEDKVPGDKPEFEVSEKELNKLEGSIFLLIFVSFLAGVISFASPCTLPILPAFIAYTLKTSKMSIKGMTLSFFLGLSLIFTLLGMSATFIGNFLKSHFTMFSQAAGVGIMLFGLYMLTGRGLSGLNIEKKSPKSYFGSFLFGAALGISWSPCVGPMLVAILLLASTSGSVITGGLLLFVYSVGLALPLLTLSVYIEKIDKGGIIWKIIRGRELRFRISKRELSMHTSSLISGILFIAVGYLIFSGALFAFNQYISATSFQRWAFGIEEWLIWSLN